MDIEYDEESQVQRTLAIIKPDGLKNASQIEEIIRDAGFHILQKHKVHLTAEQAYEFYREHHKKTYFTQLISYICSAPVIVLCLVKKDAIRDFKILIGPPKVADAKHYFPDSIRATFGNTKYDFKNAIHGSETLEKAEKDMHFFFPEMILEPLWNGVPVEDYIARIINPTLHEGLFELCKVKPVEPVIWLADWLHTNNPNKELLEEQVVTTAN